MMKRARAWIRSEIIRLAPLLESSGVSLKIVYLLKELYQISLSYS
jgi:hypothetical protein